MKKLKLLSLLTALLISVSFVTSGCNKSDNDPQGGQSGDSSHSQEEQAPVGEDADIAGVTEIRSMTTMELVHDMGQGINLGNTLEACGTWISPSGGVFGYETAWGSPIITKEAIQGYADLGFGVLRIPVAWSNLMEEDYTISEELMDRVMQVVDWTLETGMYAIVNIHWDGGWWEKFPEDTEECMKKYTRIWEQICEAFKDYGDKLMFESLNEELQWNNVWNQYSGSTDGKAEVYDLANSINQQFVDTVRASGGNNKERHLLIAGYNTDVTLTCDELFKMPDDPAGRCAVSVHYYTPSTFCILDKDESWGKAKTTWGSDSDLKELQKYMDMLKTTFIDKGIPVIVGEYGVAAKGNKEKEQIDNYMIIVTEAMYEAGLCPVIWDVHNDYYNRNTHQFLFPEMLEKIMEFKENHA
ncbi:MAG: glycoside hydrolase family 5 protein [Oscillospiraceae bacterium]|nr:glycoside hydrolase family 5 protein [Oscillospiraceae bacterium]